MVNKIDYSKLFEITVKSQEELDAIPDDFKGRIYIQCATKIYVKKSYYQRVEARENSSVVARGNSSVVARGNSSVVARENSSVEAWENSSVVAWENSSVVAWGNSSVVAWGNSSVVARENSSVEAWGNVQVCDRLSGGKIKINGNARIVYMPKSIFEFMDFYGIKHTKTKAIFYKAVQKLDGKYVSNYDFRFEYKIGRTKETDCDKDVEEECSYGIHISTLDFALQFGCDFNDLAILEVETKISDIVLPNESNGKVRTPKIKVLREVPLSECGIYGQILAKRKQK